MQAPWSYVLTDGSMITFEPWIPNVRSKPLVKLLTPTMRMPVVNPDKGKSAVTPAARLAQATEADTDAPMAASEIDVEAPAKVRRGADTAADNL